METLEGLVEDVSFILKYDPSEVKTTVLPIASIDKGKRAREDMGHLKQLAFDIAERGLIHPIAVLDKSHIEDWGDIGEEVDPEKPYLLLAGGRRLTAHEMLGLTEIPARIFAKPLNPDQIKILELHENIMRKDLTWQEEVDLKKRIHELWTKIKGPKTSTAPDASGHSMRDTAKMFGKSPASISQDIKLATAIEHFPELAEQKTKHDAQKRYNKLKADLAYEELARRQRAKKADSPVEKTVSRLRDSYIIGDFFKRIKKVDSEIFDLINMDPPYAINLKAIKREGHSGLDTYNEVDENEFIDFMHEALQQAHRVLKDNGWLLLWFGPEPWFCPMLKLLREVGFDVKGIPAIWVKTNVQGQTQQPDYNLSNTYEMFFYAQKGGAKLARPGSRNSFMSLPLHPNKKIHPTEKPVVLMKHIFDVFAFPGATILSPFAGSGVDIKAAYLSSMNCTGFDLSPEYKNRFDVSVEEFVTNH